MRTHLGTLLLEVVAGHAGRMATEDLREMALNMVEELVRESCGNTGVLVGISATSFVSEQIDEA